ncbi:PLC-like phosphodiesterase [Mycena amicta]|nr:PLC-like phosphodiesterase [Mycena amicta]
MPNQSRDIKLIWPATTMAAPSVAPPSEPTIPLLLIKGTRLTKINEKSQKKVIFRIDPEAGAILYESRKNGVLPIETIKEIRTGVDSDAQNYCKQLGLSAAELDRWISIVYVLNSTYKTLHILAPTRDILLLFESTVRKLYSIRVGLMKSLDNSQMRQSVWERQYFKLGASKDAVNDSITLEEVKALCVRLNANLTKSELEQLFKDADAENKKSLNFKQFQKFVRLLKRRPELEVLHKKIRGEQPFDFAVFEKFMKDTQKSELDSDHLQALFAKYASVAPSVTCSTPPTQPPSTVPVILPEETAQPPLVAPAATMSLDDFTAFLMSEDSSAIKPESNDMTHPISDYFISTSHNTYLVGNQLVGVSTIEGYIRALLCACRSVELDIYDGPLGPVVYHGRTFTSQVAVHDICTAIAKYAFVASPFPVLLSCEVHCGVQQQDMLVDIMTKTFGASLVRVHEEEHTKITALPTPEELKGRIMVKTKNLLLSQGIESIVAHKKAAKAAAAKAAHLEVESSSSESSVSESETRVVMDEIGEGISELKSKWRKLRGGSSSTPDATQSKSKSKKPAMSLALASLLVYTVGVKYRGMGKVDEYAPEQIFSLSESKANKFIKGGAELENLIRHTQTHVVRIYPKGTRVNSTNYEPLQYWAAGCQLVALNIQTLDLGYRINQAMFMRCGRQGYVLKPPALRDPTFKLLQNRTQAFFDVTIISAQQVPLPKDASGREILEKSNIDPYVEVVLHIPAWSEKPFLPKESSYKHTPPSDPDGASARKISFATTAVKDNGFNPMFQEELCLPFDCLGGMRELIFVEFLVKQDKKPDLEPLASYIAPLSSLQHGFRHLPLHDSQLSAHLFSTLFVHINIREV